jgi:hypothetical protein
MWKPDLSAKLWIRLKRIVVLKGEKIERELADSVLDLSFVFDRRRQLDDP